MRCLNDHTKTIPVAPGLSVEGDLNDAGILRFERQRGSMAGKPVFCVEDGVLAVHYADGASVYIRS